MGLLGAVGALIGYGCYRVVDWTPALTGRAYGHRSDFAEYYLTASIGERFGWRSLYSSQARDAVASTFSAPPIKRFPIDFPPAIGWLVRPFTALGLNAAYWIWLVALIVAYVVTWRLLTEGSWLKRVVLLVAPLTLFPVVFGFTLGQVVGFELLGVAIAYACLSRQWDFWAGLALSPLLLHPQCFLLVPIILVPLQRWRAAAGFLASAALQGLFTVAVLGESGVRAFLHQVHYVHEHRIEIWPTLSVPFAVHNRVAADAATASVVLLVIVVARWNRRDVRTAFAAAIVGSLLIAPFIHIQDEMSLVVAGWLLLGGRRRLAGFYLPLAAGCLMAFEVPSTGFSWGYLLMGVEAAWLISLLLPGPDPAEREGKHFARPHGHRIEPTMPILEPVGSNHFSDHRNALFGTSFLADSVAWRRYFGGRRRALT